LIGVKKNVPTEITSLLEQGGYSLHIKGPAGTGKTTLVLEMAKSISPKGNAIYLSTRVSPERILTQFPWVRDCLEEQNILDAKRYYITSYDHRSGKEYIDQPEFLKSISGRIQESERRPVTVIIDSLDALKSNLNIPEGDTTLENILLELGEKTATNMLFVSEIEDCKRLDFLTDGVVRLEREIVDGRLIRKIHLEKIRGEKIRQPYYLFTLNENRFTSFKTVLFPRIKYDVEALAVKPSGILFPTGIRELDNIVGGILRGSFSLIENAKDIGADYNYITFPTIQNFVQRGCPVFVTSPYSASTQFAESWTIAQMGLEENIISRNRKHIFYFEFAEPKGSSVWNTIHVSNKNIDDFSEVYMKSVSKITEKFDADTFLWFLGVDTMERIYGEESFRRAIGTLAYETSNLNGIIIALAKVGVKSMDSLIHLAATHFVLDNVGVPVMYGVYPQTRVLAIVPEPTSNGRDRIALVPVE